jgi:hypothetical protein
MNFSPPPPIYANSGLGWLGIAYVGGGGWNSFPLEMLIIFAISIKKGIKWCIQYIPNSIIWFGRYWLVKVAGK